MARRAAGSRAAGAVVEALERAHGGGRPGTLAVLTYHRVDEPDAHPDRQASLLSATPSAFRSQMEAIAARWTPVSIDDVLEARRAGPSALPRRAVLVTIDDAYDDAAIHAWPALRAVGVPAVLFVPTGFPDQPERSFWWDDLHRALQATTRDRLPAAPVGALPLVSAEGRRAAFRRVRAWFKATRHEEAVVALRTLLSELGDGVAPSVPSVLGWDELRRLAREGLALAAHSVTHAMLDRLPDRAAVVDEIVSSRRRLAAETGCDLPVFAYPSGQHDDAVVAATAEAGMEVAFTTVRGHNRLGADDWLRLRRIHVSARMPTPVVRAQLIPGVPRLVDRVSR